MFTFFKRLGVVLIFSCLAVIGYAQESLSQKTIRDIQIDIRNVQSVGPEMVKSHISLTKGSIYVSTMADQSIRSLYRTGLFDYIKVSVQDVNEKEIDLIFQVFPKLRVSHVAINGSKVIPEYKLIKKIKVKAGDPLDESKIKADADKLFELYEDKGFYKTAVSYVIEKDEATGLGKVIFNVQETEKIKITNLSFVGNKHFSSNKLKSLIKTSRWHIFSFLTSKGYIKENTIKDDIEKIQDAYKDLGFLDVEVKESNIVMDNYKPGKTRLVFHIQEGRQYYVGAVQISGNTLYNKEKLAANVRLKSDQILSAGIVDADVERLTNYYGQFGYLDTRVTAERKPNLNTGKIDVNYTIKESEKFYVENILIQGNPITKSTVIVRELALAPGDVFDLVRMKNSESRLKNTGFFKQVNITAEDTNIPNRRNLKISVQEAKTTHIEFGGGFSSLEKFGVFTQLTLSNFDLFHPQSYFRGAGQKFRLRLGVAQKSNEIILGFEEPWFCQRELAVGFEAFRTQSKYVSDYYDQSRIGIETYMRKWFFERIEGKVFYSVEQVRLENMSSKAPSYIQAEKGNRTVCKLGVNLTYDTRDNFLVPHEGTRLDAIAEVAGGPAFGPTKYTRWEGRAGHWINTFETLDQVLGFYGRTGTIFTFGGTHLPLFEHYFLGGPDNLRGYEYRQASPRFDDKEPSGGRTFGFFTTEYSFKIVDPMRLVAFYDWGFVNRKTGDFSMNDFQHDVGVGLRIFIMGAPLRLDLGFPLKEKAYGHKNKTPVFSWSFGTSF